jgi:hypothetical protein
MGSSSRRRREPAQTGRVVTFSTEQRAAVDVTSNLPA